MASKLRNKGIVYWTKLENQILEENIDKSMSKLRNLLPSRSDSAIYQRKLKVLKSKPKQISQDTVISRSYPVLENQTAQSISFSMQGINITINFQK